MVEIPLSGGSTGAIGLCDPKELASAEVADLDLSVVYGWRESSEDPIHGMG